MLPLDQASDENGIPLERFLRRYLLLGGGTWEELEPQVYDVLLPRGTGEETVSSGEADLLRIVFDPEALPDHPGAQLASYGTPLVDRLLLEARRRGGHARLHVVGLNLVPRNLEERVRRALTLAEGLDVRIGRARPLDFPQAVFWFEASFVSDQKEEEILPVAVDLHYGRHVRHLEALLDASRLADQPARHLPQGPCSTLSTAYRLAWDRAARTVTVLANTRARELGQRLELQRGRMRRYYGDLRGELEAQGRRASSRGEDLAKLGSRRDAIDREEKLRIAELESKSSLAVRLRVTNLLLLHQPKLSLRATLAGSGKESASFELVWDPLLEALEALPCPACGRPVYDVGVDRQGRVVCLECVSGTEKVGAKKLRSPSAARN